jgi:uncharacterized protein YecE (DUF72 family)
LGVILFQTPASHPFDIDSLERFLDDLPTGYKYAFEFRNREYYATEIYELLASRNMDFAYVSEPEGTPFAGLLAPFKYFRMHGARNRYESDYSDEELRLFGEELMRVQRAGCDEVYVYFNNDFNAFAPQNALTLMNIIEEINAE